MKKSNEAMEIEQLKNKIEQYRRALASIKTENSSDIHLKRRVASVEKNIENLNEQVQELAQLVDEGIAYLSNEIKELAEKRIEKPIEKREPVKSRVEPARFGQIEQSTTMLRQQDTQTNSQQSSLPSFRQLKELAQQPPLQTNEPSKHNTPRFYTPAIPLEQTGIRELEPVVYEEANSSNRGETIDTSVKPLSVQTSRAFQESKEPQPIHRVNQLYGSDENEASPFWKMFKKK